MKKSLKINPEGVGAIYFCGSEIADFRIIWVDGNTVHTLYLCYKDETLEFARCLNVVDSDATDLEDEHYEVMLGNVENWFNPPALFQTRSEKHIYDEVYVGKLEKVYQKEVDCTDGIYIYCTDPQEFPDIADWDIVYDDMFWVRVRKDSVSHYHGPAKTLKEAMWNLWDVLGGL